MFSKAFNSKKQGDIGLAHAIAYFTQNYKVVSLPLSDNQDYDLIVEDYDSKLFRVQVKTCSSTNKWGIYMVTLKTCGGNSKKNHIHKTADIIVYDLLFVLAGNGETYCIPKEHIKEIRNQINLGSNYQIFRVNGGAEKTRTSEG